ncbi:chaplin [Streptomyces sp. NPDC004667]|uniref:chaplin n=1 Tax=Streptomyces sp. NPDC004667 TaxID=3154285 RepID=UPI0033B5EBA0
MRHSRRNGLIAAMVAGGGLAVAGVGALAHADADAGGRAERSPGLLSGNLVQLPVYVPVNVCGNTVSVVGVLNSASGNRCANGSAGEANPRPRPAGPGSSTRGSAASSTSGNAGGAVADGRGKDSPGLLSGNGLQLPVDLPLNISGNSVSVVGVGNASQGNTSVNGQQPPTGGKPVQPPVAVRPVTPPAPPVAPAPAVPPHHSSALAHTGSEGLGYLLPGSGVLLLGGVVLYRRFRVN